MTRPVLVPLFLLALIWSNPLKAEPKLYFSEDSNSNGLFLLNLSTGSATLVGSGITGVNGSTVGLTESDDPEILFGSRFSGVMIIAADGSGSTRLGTKTIEGMAYDRESGILYGAANGSFFTLNPTTGAVIQNLPGTLGSADVEGLAVMDGKVYGLADDGGLMVYDPGTNAWTLIGNIGMDFDQAGLAADPLRKVLYAKGNDSQDLFWIDPNTAAATVVGSTGLANGGGLGFVRLPSRPDARVTVGTKTVGSGVINDTGSGQILRASVSPRGSVPTTGFILVPLDEEDILIASAVARRIRPTFLYKESNITAQLLAGTWQSAILGASEEATISTRILPKSIKGKTASLRLTATSFQLGSARDTTGLKLAPQKRPKGSSSRPAPPRVPIQN